MSRTFDIYNYNNLGTRTLGFKAHASLDADDVGNAVTLTSDFTVGLGSDGDPLIGKLNYVFGGYATVIKGDVVIYDGVSGSLPSEGDNVVVNGSGAVRAATSADAGYEYSHRNIVIGVDSTTYKVAVLS